MFSASELRGICSVNCCRRHQRLAYLPHSAIPTWCLFNGNLWLKKMAKAARFILFHWLLCHFKLVIEEIIFFSAFLKIKPRVELRSHPVAFFPPFSSPSSCLWHTLFSSKIKNEDGLFKTDNSNGPSCNVLLNLSSANYVVERNFPA